MRCINAAFAGTLIFSMCSKNQPKTDHQIYIGVACYDQKDTFIGELLDSFKEECSSMEKQGYAISMTIMDAAKSQRVQNDQIKQMINDGCNVLCVNLADRTEPSEIIDAAREKDIPIIFFNREPVEEDLMRWDKPNGIALEKLSYQIANWNRAQAQTRMMQLIGEYKTDIEMVIANSDSMVLGAVDAYEKLGYTESNIPVFFGIDGTKEGLKAVQEGKIAATVYNDKEGQAKAMVKLITAAVTGKGMENITFENKKCVYLPYKKVTKENVSSMIP